MNRKDCESIAAIIRSARQRQPRHKVYGIPQRDIIDDIASELADLVSEDDPRFNQDQFLSACGLDQ